MNPELDYRIEVDRAKAKEARKPAEDMLNFVSNLWDLIPELPYGQRPWHAPSQIPDVEDRSTWHEYLNGMKNAQYGSFAKSTVMQKLRDHFTKDALAFKVTVVPDTKVDHTEHWSQVETLRVAGMLEQFEGPVKKKKVRKKQGSIVRSN
jgi:hypothetical protein